MLFREPTAPGMPTLRRTLYLDRLGSLIAGLIGARAVRRALRDLPGQPHRRRARRACCIDALPLGRRLRSLRRAARDRALCGRSCAQAARSGLAAAVARAVRDLLPAVGAGGLRDAGRQHLRARVARRSASGFSLSPSRSLADRCADPPAARALGEACGACARGRRARRFCSCREPGTISRS